MVCVCLRGPGLRKSPLGHPVPQPGGIVSWISQTFLQLVLLSVVIVGQNSWPQPTTSDPKPRTKMPAPSSTNRSSCKNTFRPRIGYSMRGRQAVATGTSARNLTSPTGEAEAGAFAASHRPSSWIPVGGHRPRRAPAPGSTPGSAGSLQLDGEDAGADRTGLPGGVRSARADLVFSSTSNSNRHTPVPFPSLSDEASWKPGSPVTSGTTSCPVSDCRCPVSRSGPIFTCSTTTYGTGPSTLTCAHAPLPDTKVAGVGGGPALPPA